MIFCMMKNIIIFTQDEILCIMVEEKLMMILMKEEMTHVMAKEEKRVAEHLFIMIGAAPLSCSPHFCNHLQTFGPICFLTTSYQLQLFGSSQPIICSLSRHSSGSQQMSSFFLDQTSNKAQYIPADEATRGNQIICQVALNCFEFCASSSSA